MPTSQLWAKDHCGAKFGRSHHECSFRVEQSNFASEFVVQQIGKFGDDLVAHWGAHVECNCPVAGVLSVNGYDFHLFLVSSILFMRIALSTLTARGGLSWGQVAGKVQNYTREQERSLFAHGKDMSSGQNVGAILNTSSAWGVYGRPSRVSDLERERSKHLKWLAPR